MFFGCILKNNISYYFNKTNNVIHLSEACLDQNSDNSKVYIKILVDKIEYNLCVLQKNKIESYKLDHFIAWGNNTKELKLFISGEGSNPEVHITGYIEMEDSEDNYEYIPGKYIEEINKININYLELNDNVKNSKNLKNDNKKRNNEIKYDETKIKTNQITKNIKESNPNDRRDSFELKISQEDKEKDVNKSKSNEKEKNQKSVEKEIKKYEINDREKNIKLDEEEIKKSESDEKGKKIDEKSKSVKTDKLIYEDYENDSVNDLFEDSENDAIEKLLKKKERKIVNKLKKILKN